MPFDPDKWENAILTDQNNIIDEMLIEIIKKTDIGLHYKQYLIHGLIDCWYEYLIKNNRLSMLRVILKHIDFSCRIEAFAYAVMHNIQAIAVLNTCPFIPHDIPYDNPPIVQAVKTDQIEAVQLLLENHSCAYQYPTYIEPLSIAVKAGLTPIVNCLLKQPCANVSSVIPKKIRDTNNPSLLDLAITSPESNIEILRAILAHSTSRDISPNCYQRAKEKCEHYNRMDYLVCIEEYIMRRTHFGPVLNLFNTKTQNRLNTQSAPLFVADARSHTLLLPSERKAEAPLPLNVNSASFFIADVQRDPGLPSGERDAEAPLTLNVSSDITDISRTASSTINHHADAPPMIPSFLIMLLTRKLTIMLFALTLVASIILLCMVASSLISYVSFASTAALGLIGLCASWKAADYLPPFHPTDINNVKSPSVFPL